MTADIIAFAAGTIVPVYVYRRTGWWLDSAGGVALQTMLLFLVGIAVTLIPRRNAPSLTWWFPAVFTDIAAIATSTAILLHVGTGNLFPIVVAFIHLLCTVAVLAGAAVVIVPRLRRRGRAQPRA